ncbi:unnamed protein product [Tenebrio molitor]|nr:unnamed protein product [Tenebrio molitor]
MNIVPKYLFKNYFLFAYKHPVLLFTSLPFNNFIEFLTLITIFLK